MKVVEGASITEEKEGYTTESMLMTYDEKEKQDKIINAENASHIYSPEFIPFYLEEVKNFALTPLEGLVYGFIRFYKKNDKKKRFYFSSKDLAEIFGCKEGTIDNTISELKSKKLIDTGRIIRVGGGTIRFINSVFTFSDLIRKGGLTSLENEIYYKKNNNKKNKSELVSRETGHFSENIGDKIDTFSEEKKPVDSSVAGLPVKNVVDISKLKGYAKFSLGVNMFLSAPSVLPTDRQLAEVAIWFGSELLGKELSRPEHWINKAEKTLKDATFEQIILAIRHNHCNKFSRRIVGTKEGNYWHWDLEYLFRDGLESNIDKSISKEMNLNPDTKALALLEKIKFLLPDITKFNVGTNDTKRSTGATQELNELTEQERDAINAENLRCLQDI